jgi:3-oxoacyl-[acyl-carrier protein] reductase
MQLELAGKKALVTGSSRGIGKAIAISLSNEGCLVTLNGRNTIDLATATSDLPDSISVAGDVTQPEQARRIIAETVERLGRLDILVCNVGSGSSVPPGSETFEERQRVFAINLWSTTNMVEAAREALIASQGVIVCVSSICGLEVIPGAPITYSAAKAALHAYIRGIAQPLGKRGVRINAVASGNILFDGSVWAKKMTEDADLVKKMIQRDVALARLGAPSDVAELVTYLASPRSSFATGSVWTIDGGQIRS